MLYVPSKFYNSSYRYVVSSDYLEIHTNTNCYTQYNTTYCDCYRLYPNLNYVYTYAYSCNYNVSSNIDYSLLSTEWVNRVDLADIFIISGIIFALIIFFVLKPIQRMFGRWLKC